MIMNWKHSDRYADGWFIGGTLEDGSHTREAESAEGGHNWPFSIYRKGIQPGVTDMCLCTGIQHLADATALCLLLNQQGGSGREIKCASDLSPMVERFAAALAGGGFNSEFHKAGWVKRAVAGLNVLTPADVGAWQGWVNGSASDGTQPSGK